MNTKSFIKLIFLLIILALYPVISPTEAAPSSQKDANLAHYLVFEQDSSGAIRPVFHRYVTLSAPLVSASDQEISALLAEPERNAYVLTLWLEDQSGRMVYRSTTTVPRWLRGEFHGEPIGQGESTIESFIVPAEPAAFVVRVPVISGTRLKLLGGRSTQTWTFEPEELAQADNLPLSGFTLPAGTIASSRAANSGNRVDLLIIGDGYTDTAAQRSKFTNDATSIMNSFFGITPYGEYRNYVNVQKLFIPSAQSGADHPPYNASCVGGGTCCGDPEMLNDPLAGTFVNTALDGTFCTNNLHRLLTTNYYKTLAAASEVPSWDRIMVIVNDTTYGGSGGEYSVVSLHSDAVEVAQHEYGHSFTNLADEYDTPYPGYASCSDTTSPACEVNVTNQTQRSQIKWRRWILDSTPIITPEDNPTYNTVIGLFEGARYLSTDMYRNTDYSLMRVLGAPFREVNSEAYVLRLYNGWSVPAAGIDNIEPGTENPSTSTTIELQHPGSVTLSATLLAPVIGPTLQVNWYVNDSLVASDASKTSASFTFTSTTTGTFDVRLDVMDRSPLIHPSQRAGIRSRRVWTVHVVELIPLLSRPSNNSFTKDNTPTFIWQAVSGATLYQLQVDDNSNFSSPAINLTRTQRSYTPGTELSNRLYYWRVRAKDSTGTWSKWSARWSFTVDTVPPAKPTLVSPANGAATADTTPTLRWRAATGAARYTLQVDNNADFSSPVVNRTQIGTSYTVPSVLANGRYYWRVRAHDKAGNVSGWSTRWSFRVTGGAWASLTDTPATETLTPTPVPTDTPTPAPTGVVIEFPTLIPTEAIDSPAPTPTEVVIDLLQRVESDQPAVQQTGEWTTHTTDVASGGSYLYSSGSFDDVLSLAFQGSQIEVIYVKHPALGTFAVEIDGTVMQLVDSVAPDSEFGAQVIVSGLADGPHTLKIYPVVGVVALDAFGVEALLDETVATRTPTDIPTCQPTLIATDVTPDQLTIAPTATSTPLPMALPFIETFESGLNWQPIGSWEFDTQNAYHGAGWFAESLTHGQSSTLTFDVQIDLRTALSPEMSFWQKMALASEDLFTVDVSLDGGLTWQVLDQQAGQVTDWAPHVLDLTAYRGQVIALRLRLDTLNILPDDTVTMGVWVDELVIQEALPMPTPVSTDVVTSTLVPPTGTDVPTETPVPPTATDIPTETPVPTEMPLPTDVSTETPVPTEVPADTPVPAVLPGEPPSAEATEEPAS